ncbi:Low-density lipoprotein receptor-related protein 2 [Galemys pyrenaicus]|uniref:Low-density lipoprotein receptor-related protein 2 n=1 Tax=Galemys pyrenaicus TaxID=202257 RepID=A0A8J6AE21_GALPY|nr:Low-density lipoprotein receptor-related protein 2 [Galemys pyrenaicus]
MPELPGQLWSDGSTRAKLGPPPSSRTEKDFLAVSTDSSNSDGSPEPPAEAGAPGEQGTPGLMEEGLPFGGCSAAGTEQPLRAWVPPSWVCASFRHSKEGAPNVYGGPGILGNWGDEGVFCNILWDGLLPDDTVQALGLERLLNRYFIIALLNAVPGPAVKKCNQGGHAQVGAPVLDTSINGRRHDGHQNCEDARTVRTNCEDRPTEPREPTAAAKREEAAERQLTLWLKVIQFKPDFGNPEATPTETDGADRTAPSKLSPSPAPSRLPEARRVSCGTPETPVCERRTGRGCPKNGMIDTCGPARILMEGTSSISPESVVMHDWAFLRKFISSDLQLEASPAEPGTDLRWPDTWQAGGPGGWEAGRLPSPQRISLSRLLLLSLLLLLLLLCRSVGWSLQFSQFWCPHDTAHLCPCPTQLPDLSTSCTPAASSCSVLVFSHLLCCHCSAKLQVRGLPPLSPSCGLLGAPHPSALNHPADYANCSGRMGAALEQGSGWFWADGSGILTTPPIYARVPTQVRPLAHAHPGMLAAPQVSIISGAGEKASPNHPELPALLLPACGAPANATPARPHPVPSEAMERQALILLLPQVLATLGGLRGSRTDEAKCNRTGQVVCGEKCISVTWLCNGVQECPDGTDEQCEEACGRHPLAWQCDDGRCIPTSWLCDGAGDCLDGSDEAHSCPEQKIQCPGSSQCRDARELCDDHDEDCEEGSDKGRCPQSHCLSGQWQCKNRVCVEDSWKCDGTNNCGDSSDEDVCAFCPEGMVRCDEGKCILESLMCDGKADCTDGTDEPPTCGKNCSMVNGGCTGQCSNTTWGVRCSCGPGWQLQLDGQSCGDVDECSMAYSPCGQLCHNTPGSYSCECVQGYQLYNGTDCRVTEDAVKILTAADGELGILNQRTGIYETLLPIKSRPTSVAYDLERSMYFWVDEVLNMFVLGKLKYVPLYPELKAVNSISLDWFTGQLYWASSFARVICAGLSDGRGFVKILEKDLVPEQLIVFPARKYLYWVNQGERDRRTIETAGMDGSDRKMLAVVTMEEPIGLSLDHVTDRLYWISKYKKSIETVKVDGSGRHTFPEVFLEDEDPLGLAVFENSFFWANKIQLFHTSLHTPKERVVLLNASISAFSVLHKSQQPKRRYPVCVPGSCSHLCLPSPVHPQGYKCVCPEGMFLLPSGTCSELKLVFSSGKRLYMLKVGFMGTSIERTLLQEHPWNIYLLDIDWKRNTIYWTNTHGYLFYSTGYSGEKQKIWTEHSVCSASVDISTGSLYWLPCDRSAIQKTRITGPDTYTLYRTSSIILHILLDWPQRVLYWVESGKHLQSMTLDGRKRQEVWRGTWTADTRMTLDLCSSSILWMTKGSDLQSLSLRKNRTHTLNKTWIDGMIVAHEPYLVTVNRSALVLWDRRMQAPFLVLKEPSIRKVIILAENLPVPDPEIEGPATHSPPTLPPPPPLLCSRSSVFCRNGKECVSREKLCDGEQDCLDGSDEKNCSQFCNRPGVFQCLDGNKCIEEKYHCDGAQQCLDGSDERDCWKPMEDCFLRCDNKTRCIPKSWLCDGNPDCSDKRDEQGCVHEKCNTSEFRCENGQCISYSLHCDGNRDCLDHSDEEGCPVAGLLQCPPGEVKCPRSGECVLAEWVCDHDLDCKDGADEKDCDPKELQCGSRQWSCASRDQCVPDSWRCDGQRDCRDGSDEAGCPPLECRSSEFQCLSSACLNRSLVCDGTQDCADGSDEGGKCLLSCSPRQCPHTCYRSPLGPVCACEQGFELASSGLVCKDVDECQKSSGQLCSQTCVNTNGSYRCTCHPGYLLEPDGHTCKATGTEPILLVAIQFNLLLYGLRSLKEDVLAATDKNLIIFSIDYDLVDQKIFWTDLGAETIKWISMDTKKKGTVVKGIKSDCLVVDWIGRNLYWIDGTAEQILAIASTTIWRGKSEYTIVLDNDLSQPQSLALDPLNGLMYWSETGDEPQIEQAGMDGSNRKILIDQGLGWPTTIALDQLSWKIFWSDDKFHSIGSANLDGTDIRMLQLTQIKSPFSVAVFEDEVFWSEVKTRTVQHMKKSTGKNRAVLIKRFEQPYGVKIMHEVMQPRSFNPCLDTQCSHLCLLSPKSKGSCHCPVGLLLADDGISCVPLKDSAFLFLVLPTVIMQVYLKNLEVELGQGTLPEHRILPFTNVNQLASVDYLVQKKDLYISELDKGGIRLLRLKESGKLSWREILSVKGTVVDLAVDWLSGNIYWIDTENPHINVATSEGQYPIALLSENLYHPVAIVLHASTAVMCFVDLGPQNGGRLGSSIECASMDGSRRKVLWQKSQFPVGLAFSDSGTRIYWADTGKGLIESIQQDGSRYRVDFRGIQGLTLFTYGQGMMFWTTVDDAQFTKVWYSKAELSEKRWFQVDQKIVDLKVYSKLSQQGMHSCSKDNGGCSHICLPNPEGKTCKCPSGYSLADTNACMETIQCSTLMQPCKDGQKCISVEQLCDGHVDCLDGSDEMGCTYSDEIHSAPIDPTARKKLTLKTVQPLQDIEPTKAHPEGTNYPFRKTFTTPTPAIESKTSETEERGEFVQPKNSKRTKYLPCSSSFCNRRGICRMEGELRKCSCMMEYGGEFCEEAVHGSVSGYIILGLTMTFPVILVALGSLFYLRRKHELKRNSMASSRNQTRYKESNQEEENLMNSETFVNEAYDEQAPFIPFIHRVSLSFALLPPTFQSHPAKLAIGGAACSSLLESVCNLDTQSVSQAASTSALQSTSTFCAHDKSFVRNSDFAVPSTWNGPLSLLSVLCSGSTSYLITFSKTSPVFPTTSLMEKRKSGVTSTFTVKLSGEKRNPICTWKNVNTGPEQSRQGDAVYRSESQGSELRQSWVLRDDVPWERAPFSPASTSTGLV